MTSFLFILLGILGLSILVTIHEFGHFLAARFLGVKVEAFSVGWGPVLFKRPWLGTEFRLSALPLGGYCKMKGEHDLQKALENKTDIVPEPGSFYFAAPWRRIVIGFAGPFANLITAILLYFILGMTGYPVKELPSRIFWQDRVEGERFPVDESGLQRGDTLIEIDGQAIYTFDDLQSLVSGSGGRTLKIRYSRDGNFGFTEVTPVLSQEGSYIIGVNPFQEPLVSSVTPGSPAERAGFVTGDRILQVNNQKLISLGQIQPELEKKLAEYQVLVIRDGQELSFKLRPELGNSGEMIFGFNFDPPTIIRPGLNPLKAFEFSFSKTLWVIKQGLRSLVGLFQGKNLDRAVSGPIRTTYIFGQAAAQGFIETTELGFANIAQLFSLIGIALFVMNLLPIPALDGGLILVSFAELLRRKHLKPLTMLRFQQVGVFIIVSLLLFSVFSDVLFLLGRAG